MGGESVFCRRQQPTHFSQRPWPLPLEDSSKGSLTFLWRIKMKKSPRSTGAPRVVDPGTKTVLAERPMTASGDHITKTTRSIPRAVTPPRPPSPTTSAEASIPTLPQMEPCSATPTQLVRSLYPFCNEIDHRDCDLEDTPHSEIANNYLSHMGLESYQLPTKSVSVDSPREVCSSNPTTF